MRPPPSQSISDAPPPYRRRYPIIQDIYDIAAISVWIVLCALLILVGVVGLPVGLVYLLFF